MSQSTGSPGRYRRSSGGLIGAMIVTVVLVVVYVGVRGFLFGDRSADVEGVDWEAQVRAGRADGKLTVAAPRSLPEGWKATSAAYETGTAPSWRLGVLDPDQLYVGVYERLASIDDLVQEHVDEDAQDEGTVTVAGEEWRVFTDSGGDYALARTVEEPVGGRGSVVVVGTIPPTEVRDFAAGLTTGD
ncbi:hypothetical protein ASG49_10810 [Marmoricola sp. Leaf446]|uniref:DUF4245 family protein n=1 Tax=Marmoricola sp. Leaf446 TaxID=1736379 RepID=UPI0006F89E69|nr:DUF4245 family protein [Marmoricola sp. Leaf446]KQT91506.1 hypothetical protein ASG49_10810 [Marmoricola sp. Leaf446]